MPRPLLPVPASDVPAVMQALRAALEAGGPAVVPQAVSAPLPEGLGGVGPGVALVIETSGSTGTPKRVALSRDALLAHASASASALRSRSDARAVPAGAEPVAQWLLCLPAHYVAGAQVLVRSIVAGSEPVVMAPGHFSPEAFAEAASSMTGDERFTSLVPVQLARLVDAAEAPGDEAAALVEVLRRFDAVLVGGQALPPELRDRALALGIRVVRTYGSSETAGGCVYDGYPIGRVRARLVDGLLELAGPTLADGYLGDPGRTAATFTTDADGTRWYRTGDLGSVADDGRVTVLGRADNVIISGGEKVLLDLIERCVRTLGGFAEAVVVAADDPEWGQVPVVVVPAIALRTISERFGTSPELVGTSPESVGTSPASVGASHESLRTSPEPVGVGSDSRPARAEPLRTGPERFGTSPQRRESGPERDSGGAHLGQSARGDATSAALAAVRGATSASLGRAAQPARIVVVDELPLLASGKPDRVALAAAVAQASVDSPAVSTGDLPAASAAGSPADATAEPTAAATTTSTAASTTAAATVATTAATTVATTAAPPAATTTAPTAQDMPSQA